jgi:hypothetical protein
VWGKPSAWSEDEPPSSRSARSFANFSYSIPLGGGFHMVIRASFRRWLSPSWGPSSLHRRPSGPP